MYCDHATKCDHPRLVTALGDALQQLRLDHAAEEEHKGGLKKRLLSLGKRKSGMASQRESEYLNGV